MARSFKVFDDGINRKPLCDFLLMINWLIGQKLKSGNGRQYFTDIIGLASTTVI